MYMERIFYRFEEIHGQRTVEMEKIAVPRYVMHLCSAGDPNPIVNVKLR